MVENKEYKTLEADELFFPRDKDGEIISKKVYLEDIKRSVVITPLPRGEWIEVMSKAKDGQTTDDQDVEIMEKHLVEPKVSAVELSKAGKHTLISKIVGEILEYSSLTLEPSDKKKIIPPNPNK